MNTLLKQLITELGFERLFHLDFETFSETDISNGVRAYATHPSTEILLAAYAYDNDDPDLYDIATPKDARRYAIDEACEDPETLLVAWNAPFEREILRHVWGIDTPADRWLDPMALAYAMSLPGSLGLASKVLQLGEDKEKDAAGKKLIQIFSKPQPKNQKIARRDWTTNSDQWAQFGDYCIRDVVAERAILNRVVKYTGRPAEIRALWRDQRINERGMPIDLDLVRAAQVTGDDLKQKLKRDCAVLTGLDNPNSPAQFLPWVQGEGYPFDSLKKDKVAVAQRDPEVEITAAGEQALSLRAQFGRTSTSKYPKIEAQTVDGRLPYTLQFRGAGRTGRWSGRGAQFQNLPRPPGELKDADALAVAIDAVKTRDADLLRDLYDKPMDVLAGCIRPTVRAKPGKILRVADYNAIENRVLGWVARCGSILDVFRHGLDPYKDFGLKMFREFYGKPDHPKYKQLYNEITKQQRTDSKPAVLGAGYMLGGGRLETDRKTGEKIKTGLWAYSEALGVNLTQEQSKRAVEVFRGAYPEVVQFWYDIDEKVRAVIFGKGRLTRRHPVGFSGRFLEIGYQKPALYIQLPSGRRLWYIRPRVEPVKMPWRDDNDKPVWKDGITYEGMNQTTRQWCRQSTHPGKLAENIVQAISADILDNGLARAEDAGFSVVLHVHDEAVTEEAIGDADHSVDVLERVLCELPDWAADLPMNAEGFESPFYLKD